MPLPSFEVNGLIYEITGRVSGGELAPDVSNRATVRFTPNFNYGRYPAVWEDVMYWVRPVVADVDAEGQIGPVYLLANDPLLNIEGLQWQCDIQLRTGGRYTFWIDAPVDGGQVDLANASHAAMVVANPTLNSVIQEVLGDNIETVVQAYLTDNPPSVANGSIGALQLANDAVTKAKMADDAVGGAELDISGTPDSTTFVKIAADGSLSAETPAGGGGDTDLGFTRTSTTVTVTSSSGDSAVLPAADGSNAGVMTSAMQTKLAGIATGATALTLGTSGSTAAAGNDSRLSDTRTPTDGTVTLAKLAAALLVTAAETIAANNNDSTVPTCAAVKAHVDSAVAAGVPDGSITDAKISTSVTKLPEVLQWTGSAWPTRAATGRPVIWVGGAYPDDEPTQVAGDIWIPSSGSSSGGDASTTVSSSTDNQLALFSGTGGKTIKPSTGNGLILLTSGVVSAAAAGTDYAGVGSTVQTLSGTRVNPRVTTIASSATPTINTDDCDLVTITALAAAITSFTSGLSGTPVNGQKLMIRIKDNGTARAITWGSSFMSGPGTLPTTTAISKVHHIGFMWDSVVSKWVCMAADPTGY